MNGERMQIHTKKRVNCNHKNDDQTASNPVAGLLGYPTTFHGELRDTKLIKLSTGTTRYLVKGRWAKEATTESGDTTFTFKEKSKALDPEAQAPEIAVVATGVKTGNRILVIGSIQKVLKTPPVDKKRTGRTAMSINEYEGEMMRVKSARAALVDPPMSVKFAARHSGRSVASIYRDVKNGHLQKPFKRGNASNWPFSVIDAYARGEHTTPPL